MHNPSHFQPAKWSFTSYTIMKTSEQAPRYNYTCLKLSINPSCFNIMHWFYYLILNFQSFKGKHQPVNRYNIVNKYQTLFSNTCRTPTFAEELLAAEEGVGEGVKPPERSFWAKYVRDLFVFLSSCAVRFYARIKFVNIFQLA